MSGGRRLGGAAGDAGRAGGRRIAGNAALQLAARVLQVASGIITLPLVARLLGPSAFGVWAAALGYVGLFSSFTELGLTSAAMIKMSAEPEREARWLAALSSLRLVVAVVLTALCAAGIPLFLADEGHLRLVALVLSVAVLLAGASALMAVFMSRLSGEVPLLIGVLQTALWLATVTVLVVVDAGVVTLAVSYVAMLGLVAVVQVAAARRFAALDYRRSRELWRPLLALAVPLSVGGLLGTIYYRIDSVLVFQIAGATESGVYGVSYRFLDPLTFFPAAVVSSLLPVFAARYSTDPQGVRALVDRAFVAMLALGLPVLVTTVVLSSQIVDLLFGDGYARAGQVLPILMVGFVAICFGNLGGYLAPVVGLRWRIAQIAGLCVVVNVGLNLLLIPEHGAIGAAWVTSVTEGVSALLLLGLSLRAMGASVPVTGVLRVVAAAAVMLGALLLTEPLGLLPALAAGGLGYAAACVALGVVSRADLRRLRR